MQAEALQASLQSKHANILEAMGTQLEAAANKESGATASLQTQLRSMHAATSSGPSALTETSAQLLLATHSLRASVEDLGSRQLCEPGKRSASDKVCLDMVAQKYGWSQGSTDLRAHMPRRTYINYACAHGVCSHPGRDVLAALEEFMWLRTTLGRGDPRR